ncbi:uncharacterized protein LOC126668647 [Mercurialis annua]|uniref:uncharacterized protein LOC126668647 n=1 Tax=Mercurialis annua TaxID=3986 RepID=UPI0024AD21B1|nr:uncharacterized protein LOC126668647 [Mercurialis annua]
MAFVISILEEISGVEALGKAAKIVKGMKIHGFLQNLIFIVIIGALIRGIWFIKPGQAEGIEMIIGLLVINSTNLVRMVFLVMYTMFYLQCKKNHGEEVKILQDSVEYTNLLTTSLVDEDIV